MSAINAPPAAATLVVTGAGARVDRAADSARAVRLALTGVPPAVASVPVAPPPSSSANKHHDSDGAAPPRPAPLIQATAAALAAVPAGAPLVLVLTTADGAQRSLVARATGPPVWVAAAAGDGGADASSGTVSVEAELVGDDGARVALARGAAAAYFGAPGGLGPTNLPGRLASAAAAPAGNGTDAPPPVGGAALLIDVAIV